MQNNSSITQSFFSLIYFSSISSAIIAAGSDSHAISLDERQRAAANTFVNACKRVREEQYGNVHFVALETYVYKGADGTTRTVEEQKVWSRDNQYFRVDMKLVEARNSKRGQGRRRRLIAAPDGYISLGANSARDHLTIRDWGSQSEGLESIDDLFVFQAAARLDPFFFAGADAVVNELFALRRNDKDYRDIPGEYELVDASLSADGSVLDIVFWWNTVFDGAPRDVEASMKCDVNLGTVLSYAAKHSGKDFVYSFEEEKEYDFARFGSIPALYRCQGVTPGGAPYTREIKLQSVDWSPVSLGIFSLEAQGVTTLQPQSVWQRRIWIILCSLALFGIVYIVKRARYRAA